MENQNKKVYINPNFNRVGAHLNKHFSHIDTNPSKQNARKIFVNPNFLPRNRSVHSYNPNQEKGFVKQHTPNNDVAHYDQNYLIFNRKPNVQQSTSNVNNIISQGLSYHQVSYDHENTNNLNNNLAVNKNNEVTGTKSKYTLIRNTNCLSTNPVRTLNIIQETPKLSPGNCKINQQSKVSQIKSRYCIIRNNRQDSIDTSTNIKNNTIKVSKYKTITLSTLKNEVKVDQSISSKYSYQSVKPKILTQKNTSLISSLVKTTKLSNFKIKNIDYNNQKIKTFLTAKEWKLNVSSRSKNLNISSNNRPLLGKKYKINNIPCKLYVKYGKCIRIVKGSCDYLHDKKHVSLCRKFIKGLCHDSNCLLSHELSDKKMPTCYFYLKGMCSKENCPYVHVKLSNRTKICQDFLKGYCEKGESCSERHVIQPSYIDKKKPQEQKKLKTPPKVMSKLKKNPTSSNLSANQKIKTKPNESDNRYFKDDLFENEECEAIKPLRCKLGSLPSYIQLG